MCAESIMYMAKARRCCYIRSGSVLGKRVPRKHAFTVAPAAKVVVHEPPPPPQHHSSQLSSLYRLLYFYCVGVYHSALNWTLLSSSLAIWSLQLLPAPPHSIQSLPCSEIFNAIAQTSHNCQAAHKTIFALSPKKAVPRCTMPEGLSPPIRD